MGRFKDVAGDLVPDILCAASQSASDFGDYFNEIRDGLLGVDVGENDDRTGFRNPVQKFLCNLGDNPSDPNIDPTQGIPGSCNAQYYIGAEITYIPTSGDGSQVTELFIDRNNRYSGPIGDPLPEVSGGGLFSISFTNTNGRINGPFFTGPTPTFTIAHERVDGEPDNCGSDGEPLAGDGNGGRPTGSGDITYDGEDGNPVTEPYTFKTGPIFKNPAGDFIVPVEICVLLFCLQVNYNLNTGEVTTGNGEPESDRCCPEIGEPSADPGADDPPPPENETRYAGAITSCTVRHTSRGFTEKGDGDGPELFVPSLGEIRFAVVIGGRRAWTIDQPIKSLTQYTKVPVDVPVYSWSVFPKKGVDITVTGVPIAK